MPINSDLDPNVLFETEPPIVDNDDFGGDPTARPYKSQITGRAYETAAVMAHDEAVATAQGNPQDDPFENLTPEQIQELFNRGQMTERERQKWEAQGVAARTFTALHEEYVPNEFNFNQLTTYAEARGIDLTSVDQLEDLYVELANKGLILIDLKKLEEQDAADRKAEAQEIKRRSSSGLSARHGVANYSANQRVDDPYSLPMSELARRAGIVEDGTQW